MRIVAITAASAMSACGTSPPAAPPSRIELVTSPGSTLLERVDRLEIIAYGPWILYEATRDADGLSVSFDIAYDIAGPETGAHGTIPMFVRGFDATGALVASGQSPEFLRSSEDRRMTIHVAPPLSIGEAPVRLSSMRADLAVNGEMIVAGGRDASGEVSGAIEFYDTQYHSMISGTMPFGRAGATLAGNLLFGGTGPQGVPTASLYEIMLGEDTELPDAFTYADYGEYPGLERTGQVAVVINHELVVTGDVAAAITDRDEPPNYRAVARANLGPLTTRVAGFYDGSFIDGAVAAVLEPGSLKRFQSGKTTTRALPAVRNGAAIVTSGRRFVIVGGAETSAFVIDAMDPNAVFSVQANVLETPRFDPTVASTSRYVLVAGGVDSIGTPIATAEILDAITLGHLATVPIAQRMHVMAVTLPNEQIALLGGDEPTDLIELFTPPSPSDYYFCSPNCR